MLEGSGEIKQYHSTKHSPAQKQTHTKEAATCRVKKVFCYQHDGYFSWKCSRYVMMLTKCCTNVKNVLQTSISVVKDSAYGECT